MPCSGRERDDMKLVDQILPSDIATDWPCPLCESFGKTEREIVAANVIIISRENSDKWGPFTWEEYQERCQHGVTIAERGYLNDLVKSEHLKARQDGTYEVTDNFIVAVWKYVHQEEAADVKGTL